MTAKIFSLFILCCISVVFVYLLFRARLRDLPGGQKMNQKLPLKGWRRMFFSLRTLLYSPFGVKVSLLVMFVVLGGLLLVSIKNLLNAP